MIREMSKKIICKRTIFIRGLLFLKKFTVFQKFSFFSFTPLLVHPISHSLLQGFFHAEIESIIFFKRKGVKGKFLAIALEGEGTLLSVWW
jgi:hypothetical protein